MPEDTQDSALEEPYLCWTNKTTPTQYRKMVSDKNKGALVEFVNLRLKERYIYPLQAIPEKSRSGFCTMAICCLLVETLESFWQGWEDTNGKGSTPFQNFFDRSNNLKDLKGHGNEFWLNVRNGVLHQGETKGSWTVRRTGDLFDVGKKRINATKFHEQLETCIDHYCDVLSKEDWDGERWQNFRIKINAICKNCQ